MNTYKGPLDFSENVEIILFNDKYTYNTTKLLSNYNVIIELKPITNETKLDNTSINCKASL